MATTLLALFAPARIQAQEPASTDATRKPRVQELITVTATRRPFDIADISAPATVVTGAELRARPAVGVDEALAWTPGFSLLRRTPARAAHPTTQGLNLRGVAPSGTSRALVLVDGLPLADAFGGWVYWSRIPTALIESVEIVPGGGSSTYGNQALAGTVQIVTTTPADQPSARIDGAGGGLDTWRAAAVVGGSVGSVRALLAAEAFDTGGYVATTPAEAGTIDTEVATRHQTAVATMDVGAAIRLGADWLNEDRANGTPERTNSTQGWTLRGRWSPGGSSFGAQLAGHYREQEFRSRFSSVANGRDEETAVLNQCVDSSEATVTAQAWHTGNTDLTFAAGADWRQVKGTSFEEVLSIGLQRAPGGRQSIGGVYGAAQWRLGNVFLEGAVRADGWRNTPNGEGEQRSLSEFSPRLGVAWHPHADWTVRAAAYRAFRAPTPNELYRQFRVGNVITRANPDLIQERLRGAEAGVEHRGRLGGTLVRARLHGYVNKLTDGVINATVGLAGNLILRQRANLGEATVRGLELDLEAAWSEVTLSLATIWIDSRIDRDVPGASISVVGNRLPQVPDYRVRLSALWQHHRWTANLAVQAIGAQFEDERNQLRLAPGSTLDAGANFQISDQLNLGLIAQNLTDQRVQVARTDVLNVGPPRTVLLRAGWAIR